MKMYIYASNIGKIGIFEEDNIITKIIFNPESSCNDYMSPIIHKTKAQIDEYLNGSRKTFDLPFLIEGTDFQKRILSTLLEIPYGEKWSYKKVALKAGFKGASRACGTVCKNNKLPLIIPCHRVIKSDGSYGEYNGGVPLKKHLLKLENNL